jgi:hypothetical protein
MHHGGLFKLNRTLGVQTNVILLLSTSIIFCCFRFFHILMIVILSIFNGVLTVLIVIATKRWWIFEIKIYVPQDLVKDPIAREGIVSALSLFNARRSVLENKQFNIF